jgi:cellulose synthase/poly-beta-1,6-N-acetylglucosamine synthase-like glycosyltransferase
VRAGRERARRVPDRDLPVYTVLVPVFREANVLPGIIQALQALDYPPAKLEIFIVLEEVDTETQRLISPHRVVRQQC